MTSIIRKSALLLAMTMGVSEVFAAGNTPIITFTTSLYELAGDQNTFSFRLGSSKETTVEVDFGNGKQKVTVKPTSIADGAVKATSVSGSVTADATVRVYGDASLIDYLDLEGCYATTADFTTLTNLDVLNLNHNQLGSVNLDPFTKLRALYVSDNPFDVAPLKIGTPKPDLAILQMEAIDHLDPSFDLTQYPAMQSFDAFACRSLSYLDPTKCPELLRISADVTRISSIDVSKNPKLLILNVSDTYVENVDVTNNPYLQELYCGHAGSWGWGHNLTSLDVTNNPKLIRLYCNGNALTDLDISKNISLQSLNCSRNQLTTIDISNNPDIDALNVAYNNLDYVTLPAERETFLEYYYLQNQFPIDRSYKEGTSIDFSAKVNRPNSTTTATLYYYHEDAPLDPTPVATSDYSYSNGVITLKKALSDSVYVEFHNSALPAYNLKTAKFMVKSTADFGKPSPVVKIKSNGIGNPLKMKIGVGGATQSSPVTFMVDAGDGTLQNFTATGSSLPASDNVSVTGGSEVTVYMPEGSDISALAIDGYPMKSIDLSQARSLHTLKINSTGIQSIDLTWNRCLRELNLSHNLLTSLDLTGANGGYGKNVLSYLDASYNSLASFTVPDMSTLYTLNLSNNKLTEIALHAASNISVMNLSNNLLEAVDLEDMEAIATLDVSHNNLTALPIASYNPLVYLDLSYNNIAMPNLPSTKRVASYIYAPQSEILLPELAPTVNLTSQWLDRDGKKTVYTWRSAADNSVIPASKISQRDGVSIFEDASIGNVYCEISHPLFPAFAANPMRTSVIKAAERPTNAVATWTPTESVDCGLIMTSTKPNTAVYIDWEGNGYLEQYVLTNETYTIFKCASKADVEARLYSYSPSGDLGVFSIDGVKLSKIDVSKLTDLFALTVANAALTPDKVVWPESSLEELNVNGNNFTNLEFAKAYPELRMLKVSKNQLNAIDLTGFDKLQSFTGDYNGAKSVKFGSPMLWDLSLSYNDLTEIDFTGAENLEQAFLSSNLLSSIDMSKTPKLNVLFIDSNCFTFQSLPKTSEVKYVYRYSPQAVVEVEPEGVTVDLSSQAVVDGVATDYRWFIGEPYYDENGDLAGDELSQPRQVSVADGVSTFNVNVSGALCVMLNSLFPDLPLCSSFIDITEDGIGEVETADRNISVVVDGSSIIVGGAEGMRCRLFDLSGRLMGGANGDNLGEARFDGVAPGVYLVSVGGVTAKVLVK